MLVQPDHDHGFLDRPQRDGARVEALVQLDHDHGFLDRLQGDGIGSRP